MESVIHALLREGVSVDEFYSFVTENGIQEDPFIQEILHQLLIEQVALNPGSPRQWITDDADDLLELLKSPEKSSDRQNERALREIDSNVLPGTSGGQIGAGKQTPFICMQCGKQFSLQRNLNQHMKGVHEKALLSCRKCGKTFTRNTKRLEHESKCHGSVAFSSGKCPEVLSGTPRKWTTDDADNLLELSKFPKKSSDHQNKRALSEIDPNVLPGTSGGQIGAGKQTPFICVQCGKQFSQQYNLNQHMKGVHEKALLPCRKCGKTFTRNAKRLEHESKCCGSVAFPCDKCPEVLKTARQLEFHQNLKHKVKPTARKTTTTGSTQHGSSTYNCRRCDAKFQHQKQLQAHNARQQKHK